ncbi:hypothetical protein AAMO2058_000393600 [Amorphochlora amoebiformis]
MRDDMVDVYLRSIKMSKQSAREVCTIAGGFDVGSEGNGSKMQYSLLSTPTDIACDPATRTLYVVDSAHHKIKTVSLDGRVEDFAGGRSPGYRDGKGTKAKFYYPYGCYFDRLRRRLLIAERYNMIIRAIDIRDSQVTTVAGVNGTYGWRDGSSSSALFCEPHHVTADLLGNIYVSDTGNHRIRKISIRGDVNTVTGVNPVQLEINRRIQEETPLSFNPYQVPPPDLWKYYFAKVQNPMGIAVSDDGTIYVALRYFHDAIVKITPESHVRVVAGDFVHNQNGDNDGIGTIARFWEPDGLRYIPYPPKKGGWGSEWILGGDGPRLVFIDTYNAKVRAIDLRNDEVRTISGQGSKVYSLIDGLAMGPRGTENEALKDPLGQQIQRAFYFHPRGIDIDLDGNIYIADTGNHAIRRISAYEDVHIPCAFDVVEYLNSTGVLPDTESLLVVAFSNPSTPLQGSDLVFWKGKRGMPDLEIKPAVRWDYPSYHRTVIVAFDLDHPKPITRIDDMIQLGTPGSRGPYLHWMVTDAYLAVENGRTIAKYTSPASVDKRFGAHRIVFLCLRQTTNHAIDYFGGFDPRAPRDTREGWNLRRFVSRNRLEPISYNFYYYVFDEGC